MQTSTFLEDNIKIATEQKWGKKKDFKISPELKEVLDHCFEKSNTNRLVELFHEKLDSGKETEFKRQIAKRIFTDYNNTAEFMITLFGCDPKIHERTGCKANLSRMLEKCSVKRIKDITKLYKFDWYYLSSIIYPVNYSRDFNEKCIAAILSARHPGREEKDFYMRIMYETKLKDDEKNLLIEKFGFGNCIEELSNAKTVERKKALAAYYKSIIDLIEN